jgi:hypothetical protein
VQRPIIAAGIRGLVVLGGPYTGPSMNPMIGFGWALYNGNHKVGQSRVMASRLV